MKILWLSLVAVVTVGSMPVVQGQYLAPRQYLRRLPQTQPPPPSGATLPPGPTVTPAPTPAPTASAAEAAKATSVKEATTQRTIEFQKKRALAGSASAQYALGLRYVEGDGVQKDLAEACKWLRAAAKQDFTWAKRKLVELEKEHGPLPPPAEDEPASPPVRTPGQDPVAPEQPVEPSAAPPVAPAPPV